MHDVPSGARSATPPGPAQGHGAGLPPQAEATQVLRVGTRGSPLALVQTRAFVASLREFSPALRDPASIDELIIKTSGDTSQDSGQRLADIGGKGLWAKEIHEALLDRRIDFAVHSLGMARNAQNRCGKSETGR